jgi:16S rRNA C1402 N4-methylase RsmH
MKSAIPATLGDSGKAGSTLSEKPQLGKLRFSDADKEAARVTESSWAVATNLCGG